MSRAAGGTYSLPAGNPVVTGTVVSSTWANSTLTDIATALTDSLSRSGLGNMTAPLLATDGTAGAPSLSFANSPTTGFYRSAADVLAITTAGTQRATINASGNVSINAPASGTAFSINGGSSSGLAAFDVFSNGCFIQSRDSGANGAISRLYATNTTNIIDFTWATTPVIASIRHGGTEVLGITTARGVTIAAPSSGVAMTIAGLEAAANTVFKAPNTGGGWNIQFLDTTAATTRGFIGVGTNSMSGAAATDFIISSGASGAVQIPRANGGVAALTVATGGNVTVAAPSSGTALVVTGIASGAIMTAAAPASGSAAIALICTDTGSTSNTVIQTATANWSSTGSTTPALTANKPGASTTILGWYRVQLNATAGWIPVWNN